MKKLSLLFCVFLTFQAYSQCTEIVFGTILDRLNLPLKNTSIIFTSLTGLKESVQTDSVGYYSFSCSFAEEVNKILPVLENEPAAGASISTLDLVLILRHILGISKFNDENKILASDINMDGKITVSDIIEIRNVILGSKNQFSNSRSVNFYSTNFAEVFNFDCNLHLPLKANYKVIKMGDVSY